MDKFDVIIIGSGPGGMAAAYDLATEGKKIAVVEADLWGGTCPNRGCDPKKVLYGAVEARDRLAQLKNKGFDAVPNLNWSELMAFKETFTQPVPVEQKAGLTSAGIQTITGKASFKDTHTIIVENKEYQSDQFILATGQRPAILDIPGKENFATSTDFLSMKELPEKIVFVGGGYISLELANIANSCGSEVHLLHHNERPLKGFDEDMTRYLIENLQNRGIHFHFNESATAITKKEEKFEITLISQETLLVDQVFCATGRIPNVEGLNLEKIGVDYTHKGIKVNDYLQTSVENIYALGDCLQKNNPKLTPVASFEGSYLAKILSGTLDESIDYPTLPTIIFSSPKLAQVGLTDKATQEHENYESEDLDLSKWFTYKHLNEPLVKAKIIRDKTTDLLVGATILGNEADQLINMFTLIINQKLSSEKVNEMIMLYPTVSSDLSYLY
ncbi:dihydrolipoyl dehydrogenase family protein [Candidatus Enterococcus ikei]|uniref:NAD(P)/FAD-dependent oxidoreductase n=1 Tax=Candidatus Enterococcus ikei TaxID=2815326 RepID=A0ABS3GZC2_9ENTE|nr:NAD(P)/FAD-dependent oxidoreductase [Enterococcus sp. DIV0869a]MBO0439809.1 NAD(P)/FAD-dependent oxidoreductase [Enterococcus sp. DIV0869a]